MPIVKSFILILSTIVLISIPEKQINETLVIVSDFRDNLLTNVSLGKDSTGLSFGIYINGYESSKKRADAIKKWKTRLDKKNSDYLRLPTFSINFLGFTKPQRISNLDGLKFITIREFSKGKFKVTNPTYMIFKQENGSYLKWKVFESNTME
jgi:hypothetical protein